MEVVSCILFLMIFIRCFTPSQKIHRCERTLNSRNSMICRGKNRNLTQDGRRRTASEPGFASTRRHTSHMTPRDDRTTGPRATVSGPGLTGTRWARKPRDDELDDGQDKQNGKNTIAKDTYTTQVQNIIAHLRINECETAIGN